MEIARALIALLAVVTALVGTAWYFLARREDL